MVVGWADMRLTVGRVMGQGAPQPTVLAGSGGVVLGEARTNHEGRRAVLLVRGDEDVTEMEALVATMGIDVVDIVRQVGRPDPRTYFGKGRLNDVADEQRTAPPSHPWSGVDLVLLHTNATPRQLVGVHRVVNVEVWDRVRLLLALFTSHASSVEARTQVRIAQLQSDRTVLREAVQQQTTGERAGFGGGGVTALQNVIANVNRELTNLRRRQQRHVRAQREHRRQRERSGAFTVGFVGYTNAGKSSLFRRLSGKSALVEDRLFSTLETTVGRMEESPRILLADTIGFIDNIPNATLSAFRATIAEAIEADLVMVLVDASDSASEIERKLATTQREVFERHQHLEDEDGLQPPPVVLVYTKVDRITADALEQLLEEDRWAGFTERVGISTHDGTGLEAMKAVMCTQLFGSMTTLVLRADPTGMEAPLGKLLAEVHDAGLVQNKTELEGGNLCLEVWMASPARQRFLHRWGARVEVK